MDWFYLLLMFLLPIAQMVYGQLRDRKPTPTDRALADSAVASLGLAPPVPLHIPPTPQRIAQLLRRYPGWWAIAGGWAIDLHLGRQTREHADIEVAVLRREQELLWEYLIGWRPQVADAQHPDGRRPWLAHERLELPLHELHCDPPPADVAAVELLLNEADGADWVYRRNTRVRLPLAEAVLHSADGIPYLAPQVVLLYKTKQPRPQDELDLAAALPMLDATQRAWLHDAVALVHPDSQWEMQL
jgi:hypothetical protein